MHSRVPGQQGFCFLGIVAETRALPSLSTQRNIPPENMAQLLSLFPSVRTWKLEVYLIVDEACYAAEFCQEL